MLNWEVCLSYLANAINKHNPAIYVKIPPKIKASKIKQMNMIN